MCSIPSAPECGQVSQRHHRHVIIDRRIRYVYNREGIPCRLGGNNRYSCQQPLLPFIFNAIGCIKALSPMRSVLRTSDTSVLCFLHSHYRVSPDTAATPDECDGKSVLEASVVRVVVATELNSILDRIGSACGCHYLGVSPCLGGPLMRLAWSMLKIAIDWES